MDKRPPSPADDSADDAAGGVKRDSQGNVV
jgi:hypothetical protein